MTVDTTLCCPADSLAHVGKILVKGHTVACTQGEPRRYVWLTEGFLRTGTIADYADDLEEAQYCGLSVSDELRTWDESFKPEVRQHPYDDNDYAAVDLTVGNESCSFRLDGRS